MAHLLAHCWTGRRRDGRGNAQKIESLKKNAVDAIVRFAKRVAVVDRSGDAVGDFAIVEKAAASGGAPHDVDSHGADPIQIVAAGRPLIAPERKRRARPSVNRKHRLAGLAGAAEKRQVPRHVLGALPRGDGQQAPPSIPTRVCHAMLN